MNLHTFTTLFNKVWVNMKNGNVSNVINYLTFLFDSFWFYLQQLECTELSKLFKNGATQSEKNIPQTVNCHW